MLVYRIESASGEGPYTTYGFSGFSERYEMMIAHSDAKHPGPFHSASGLEGIDNHEVCGFNSLDSLLEWFWDFLFDLALENFLISVYEVDEARIGRYGQTLFDKDDATMVDRYNQIKIIESLVTV